MREEAIESYLGKLAAREPAPGGGAAAALHLAQAAALVGMVARYSTGEKYRDHAVTIERIASAADAARETALGLAEADAEAFAAVSLAYRLPKTTEEEKAARSRAIAAAYTRAAEPPADVIDVSHQVLELAETLLPIGNRNVITDVGAASEALRAAATTSRLNVEINLGGITDPAVRDRCAAATKGVDNLVARTEVITKKVREAIR